MLTDDLYLNVGKIDYYRLVNNLFFFKKFYQKLNYDLRRAVSDQREAKQASNCYQVFDTIFEYLIVSHSH